MMQRIQGVRQDDTSEERAWYQDDFFDLFVWSRTAGVISAFQLCYDRQGDERVLAWSEAGGFLHRRIDSGESSPMKNMTPIMVMDGHFEASRIQEAFTTRANALDPQLRDFLLAKILEAGREMPAPAAT